MAWTRQISIGLCLFCVSGCSDIKKTVGISKVPPKDFSVDPYPKGLEVPPDFGALPQGPKTPVAHPKKEKMRACTPAENELMSRLSRKKEGAK